MSTPTLTIEIRTAPSFDHSLIASDAMVEFDELFELMQANTFTNEALREDGMTLLRGMVCRLHSLAEVMYAAATTDDCRLKDLLRTTFGSDRAYVQAPEPGVHSIAGKKTS